MNLNKIWEGIRNSSFPPERIKNFVDKVAKDRISICRKCPFHTEKYGFEQCGKCGCSLKWKTHSLSSNCPDSPHRWTAIEGVRDDESNYIDTITGNDD